MASSKQFPGGGSSEALLHGQEIERLHREVWIQGGGAIQLGSTKYAGKELKRVSLDELQVAMWSDRRPIVVGREAIESRIWGNLRPYIANLNSPHELFKLNGDVGYAYYLVCLSVVLGHPIAAATLPKEAKISAPEMTTSPFAIVEAKHARRRQGRPEVTSSLATTHEPKRLVVSLTLKELAGLFPPEGSTFPRASAMLETVNASGVAGDLMRQPFGLWRKLLGGGSANLYEGTAVIYMPGVTPQSVFEVMRDREKWIEFYPGLFGMEEITSLRGEKAYRLEFGTPLGPIRILSSHSDAENELQIRWDDPAPEQVAGLGLEGSGTIIQHVRGSMTFLDAGNGTYVCYCLAMDAPKFNAQGTREVGFMNRIIPIALSAHARALNPAWGFPAAGTDAFKARLAMYRASFDPTNKATVLKSAPPSTAIPYNKVWTVENPG